MYGRSRHHWCTCCGKGVLYAVTVLLFLTLTLMAGLEAKNLAKKYRYIGVPVQSHTITFTGQGKAIGVPNVAKMDLGMTVEKPTVLAAQQENTRVMNQFVTALKGMGVDAKDIQTSNYTVSPMYDYSNGKQSLRGYQVSQSVQVTVRNLDNVGKVLGEIGPLGLNQVGGIQFTVDDPHQLQKEARDKAVADAKQKAQDLSKAVGVTLGRVVNVQESVSNQNPQPIMYDKAMGIGGAAPTPTAEPGSTEVDMTASITYEIQN